MSKGQELLRLLGLPKTTTELHVHCHPGQPIRVEAKFELLPEPPPRMSHQIPVVNYDFGLRGNGMTDTLCDQEVQA